MSGVSPYLAAHYLLKACLAGEGLADCKEFEDLSKSIQDLRDTLSSLKRPAGLPAPGEKLPPLQKSLVTKSANPAPEATEEIKDTVLAVPQTKIEDSGTSLSSSIDRKVPHPQDVRVPGLQDKNDASASTNTGTSSSSSSPTHEQLAQSDSEVSKTF